MFPEGLTKTLSLSQYLWQLLFSQHRIMTFLYIWELDTGCIQRGSVWLLSSCKAGISPWLHPRELCLVSPEEGCQGWHLLCPQVTVGADPTASLGIKLRHKRSEASKRLTFIPTTRKKLNKRIKQNGFCWKSLLKSLSPTVNLTLTNPEVNHVPNCHKSFTYSWGWRLHHFPGKAVQSFTNFLMTNFFS